MKKLSLFLATIAPGIVLIGYNIGTGSITTMASSGASFGMSLVWPLLLSCIFTYFLIRVFGQYTAVTGETILFGFRKHFGKGWALFVMLSILLSEWLSIMGVMGVVVEVVNEWSRPFTASGNGFSPVLIAAIFAAILYYIFWKGTHRLFERVLAFFVAIMGISFLLTMFMVNPDPAEIVKGLIPELPSSGEKLLLMAGMVGTTMGTVLFLMRSILVHEKGWTVQELHLEKRDAFISAAMMFVLSTAIMIAAAGTLYPKGLKVDNAIDMVTLLEPLAGRFAISIFVGGIICAGLSSLFPNFLLAPWFLADYEGQSINLSSTRSRILVLLAAVVSLTVPLFGGKPVLITIIAQAGIAVVSPLALILMLILINRRGVMGEFTANTRKSALLLLIIVFTMLMAVAGIAGISDQLQSAFS